jgi:septal ring factor EnvC (AmiA/AmiB activator)
MEIKDIRLRRGRRGSIMKNMTRSLLVIFILILISQSYGQGKSDSEVIETAVAKLQQKVLLSDQQAADLKTVLKRNAENISNNSTRNKAITDSKSKLEGMLDARQKAKYSIIKDDWWNTLAKDLSQ